MKQYWRQNATLKWSTALQDITQYNLESRYPDEKFEFYKRATANFTKKALKDIKTIRLWLDSSLQ